MMIYQRVTDALPILVIVYLQVVDIVEGGMRSCYFGPIPQPKPGDDPLNVYRWMLQSVQNGCRNEQTNKHQVCGSPLGLENGDIPDGSITASSYWGIQHEPYRARLNTQRTFASAGAWCKAQGDPTPWIQVDFESKVNITGLITQGRDPGEPPVYNWVITFTVEFSDNGLEWSTVMTAGGVPLESGNTDSETQVTVTFAEALFARYLRILPKTWFGEWACCMRFEVLVGGSAHGMENGDIPDGSITASSYWGIQHEPYRARLNTQRTFASAGAWCKTTGDQTSWIQVDFESKVNITGLITQGRDPGEPPVYNWVITFTVEFSDNGLEWSTVMTADGVPLESGNTDGETPVTVIFAEALFARYLRILPTLWKDECCMRFEVLGCRQ